MDHSTLLIYIVLAVLLILMLVVMACVLFFMKATQPELTETELRLRKVSKEGRKAKTNQAVSSWVDAAFNNDPNKRLTPFQKILVYWPERWGLRFAYMQTGLELPFEKYVQYFLALPFFLCSILLLLTQMPFFLIGMIFIPAGAVVMILWRKRKRIKRVEEQLPDSLNMMTSALRAGHSFQSCINLISEEVAPPIGEEFHTMSTDLNLGLPVKDSMSKFIEQVDIPDVRMFCTAILIQRESGGNLAEILDSLSHTIRERFKLKRQISALTAQARISAYVMAAAPFVLFVFLYLFMNSYIEPLYTNPIGIVALIVGFFMQLIGGFIMYKIVSIRI